MNQYEENTIFAKEGDDIHYLAYGYYSEDDSETPFRFLEYTWFIVPVEDVETRGFDAVESEDSDQFKQYIEDCTEETMIARYQHYDAGNHPKWIEKSKINRYLPDGCYIAVNG